MASKLCRFTFPRDTNRRVIEDAVAQAIFAAECIHGSARVRLATGYFLSRRQRPQCVIDTSCEIGEHVAQVFTGLMSRELGEDGIEVERLGGDLERVSA